MQSASTYTRGVLRAWGACALAATLAFSLYAHRALAQLETVAEAIEEEVTVHAESILLDQNTNTIVAKGHVVIRHGETEIHADEVRLNRTTNEAEAIGNVRVTDPEGILFAERVNVNIDEETGALFEAQIYSPQRRYSLTGQRMEKGPGQTYSIAGGKFTTCDCGEGEKPSWSIAASQLNVDLNGLGWLKGARFNILDVPVLYFPRLVVPVNRERQSGLLVPRIGLSNRRGFQIVQPVYWAIDKSQDATLGLDVETSARLGVIGEYRYALSPTFHGTFGASYFNEEIRGRATETVTRTESDPEVPVHRWGITAVHDQKIGSADAYVDLQIIGDNLYLREINAFRFEREDDIALRTRPFTESRAGVLQRFSRAVVQGEVVYYQDLIGRDTIALKRLPEVRVNAQKQVGLDLLGQLDASLTNFQRAEGIAGFRGDLQPAVQLRLPLGKSFLGSLALRLRQTAYALTDNKMEGGFRGDEPPDCTDPADPASCSPVMERLPATETRETLEILGTFGTGVSRIFDFPYLGVDKLKHIVEPQLSYLYIPHVEQDEVMVFDGLDRINRRNLITYGLSSRLLARSAIAADPKGPAVYELARVSLWQSVDFERKIPRSLRNGKSDHFSDIDFGLRVNPIQRTSLRFHASYDPTASDLSAVIVGLRFLEGYNRAATKDLYARLTTRTTVGVAYRFVTDNPLMLGPEEPRDLSGIEQIDSDITLRVIERLGLLYANRYNLRSGQFLENYFGFRLISSCDCWSIDLGITDKSNPNEIELRAQVQLVGLTGGFGNAGR